MVLPLLKWTVSQMTNWRTIFNWIRF